MVIQNYHKHSYHTNPKIADSVVSNEDYAKRAVELGHGIISIMEHGWQGRYIEGWELAKKYNLKFVFGTECYWVKDRFEKDRTNSHIYIGARNENGRQCINDILSEANITGIYHQPRIDLSLLFSLPKNDVIITSACVAYWKYDDIDEITKKIHDYFESNFYIELQYHDTDLQRKINKHGLEIAEKYGIKTIMGCDSHFIHQDTAWERDDFIKSKNIFYEDEEGWFMDYPDSETAYDRFVKQGILTESQIIECMNNTNVFLEVEEYDNPCFNNFDIKMPTIYPNLKQEEKDKLFVDLVYDLWEKEKKKIPSNKIDLYESEIKKEIDIIITTKHADYFLIDYDIVKEGIKNDGIITNTGRGSAPSFYLNKLLGFTDVDRIAASVKMYPERFMSATRILEAKTLADLDLNLATPDIFAQAQKKIFGENHSYPMVAYGTMQPKSAWKMYARSQDIEADIADSVSKEIEKYEKAMKYAEEDDKEDINVLDYINEEYHEIFSKSEKYLNVVDNIKPHPCAHLIYQGDIRREIGLIMIKAKQSKKEVLCCVMDGKWAEEYKFLKNDLLKVSAIENIKKIYNRIGIPIHEVNELLEICNPEHKVWNIYKTGATMGINQVEQTGTSSRVTKYAPSNISELCAFVAAIRPGFKSMYKIFANREDFSYGIKSLDDLIQTEEFPQSFILYQEIQMAVLNYSGIPMVECYEIIKNIAKKRVQKVLKYKDIFLSGFSTLMIDVEDKTEDEAYELSHKIWQILEDSSRYSFNASHSYCVAIDSLYGAYLKSEYPIYFYEVFLNILEAKGEKDRMVLTKNEAQNFFGIHFPKMLFRQDNRQIVAVPEENYITNSIKSIKNFSSSLAEELYSMKDMEFNCFVDLLVYIEETFSLSKKIGDLIKLQYFDEFGKNKKLYAIYEEFQKGKFRYDKRHVDKTKIKRIEILRKIEESLENISFSLSDQMTIEKDILGYIQCTYKVDKRYAYVMEIDQKYAPRIELYCLNNGKNKSVKIYKRDFSKNLFKVGDILYCEKFTHEPGKKLVSDEWIETDEMVWWLKKWRIENIDLENL